MENKFLRLAINYAGGPTRVAQALGVCNNTVHNWIRQGGVSKISSAFKLAKMVNCDYKKLLKEKS